MEKETVFLSLGGGSLTQLSNSGKSQMIGYFIRTPEDKNVIIDGGTYCEEDAAHLYETIKANGEEVDAWFITHGHGDHFGALLYLMQSMESFDIVIKKLYFDFPPLEWFREVEAFRFSQISAFLELLREKTIPCERTGKGRNARNRRNAL